MKKAFIELYREILDELKPQSRVCYWDSTSFCSSKYDKDAEKGIGTRLGWFYGYKFHVIASEDLLPLSWDLTPANFYDNQVPQLIRGLSNYDVFMILADSAYDDHKLFHACEKAGIHLTTQVNMRRSKSRFIPNVLPSAKLVLHYVYRGLGKKHL